MAAELLVHAVDAGSILKGMFQFYRDAEEIDNGTRPWGTQEGPPGFCYIRIRDASVAQVDDFVGNWVAEFTVAFTGAGSGVDQYRVDTDSRVTAVFGGDIVPIVEDVMMDFGGTVTDATNSERIDCELPFGAGLTRRLFEDEVRRRYGNAHDTLRYQVDPAMVDTAIAQPTGRLVVSTAEVLAGRIDRLNPGS